MSWRNEKKSCTTVDKQQNLYESFLIIALIFLVKRDKKLMTVDKRQVATLVLMRKQVTRVLISVGNTYSRKKKLANSYQVRVDNGAQTTMREVNRMRIAKVSSSYQFSSRSTER